MSACRPVAFSIIATSIISKHSCTCRLDDAGLRFISIIFISLLHHFALNIKLFEENTSLKANHCAELREVARKMCNLIQLLSTESVLLNLYYQFDPNQLRQERHVARTEKSGLWANRTSA